MTIQKLPIHKLLIIIIHVAGDIKRKKKCNSHRIPTIPNRTELQMLYIWYHTTERASLYSANCAALPEIVGIRSVHTECLRNRTTLSTPNEVSLVHTNTPTHTRTKSQHRRQLHTESNDTYDTRDVWWRPTHTQTQKSSRRFRWPDGDTFAARLNSTHSVRVCVRVWFGSLRVGMFLFVYFVVRVPVERAFLYPTRNVVVVTRRRFVSGKRRRIECIRNAFRVDKNNSLALGRTTTETRQTSASAHLISYVRLHSDYLRAWFFIVDHGVK